VPATVYLDSSFLMLSAKFHLDVLSESRKLLQGRTQFAVPVAVAKELKALAKSQGARGRDARIALELIQERKIRSVSSATELDADMALVEMSKLPNAIVATADGVLRRKIRNTRKPVIFFREKAKLELEGIEASYW